MYEQICISPVLRSISNQPHCQKTVRGYRLPEKWPLVCISQSCTSTNNIFDNNDILDLAQKRQISISVAAEIIVRCLFFMKQEILSAIYWYSVWSKPTQNYILPTSEDSKRGKRLPTFKNGRIWCVFYYGYPYLFYLNLSLFKNIVSVGNTIWKNRVQTQTPSLLGMKKTKIQSDMKGSNSKVKKVNPKYG